MEFQYFISLHRCFRILDTGGWPGHEGAECDDGCWMLTVLRGDDDASGELQSGVVREQGSTGAGTGLCRHRRASGEWSEPGPVTCQPSPGAESVE